MRINAKKRLLTRAVQNLRTATRESGHNGAATVRESIGSGFGTATVRELIGSGFRTATVREPEL